MSNTPAKNATETRTTPRAVPTPHSPFRSRDSAWIVLMVGLLLTAAATLYMKSSVEKTAEHEFVGHGDEIQHKISKRLDDYARILQSGAALFNASDQVTRDEWRFFTQAQKVEKQLPGIQGSGFSLLIPRQELPRHLQQVRSEGFLVYKLWPEGDREFYTSTLYLEPISALNLRAFGYDMLSEPVRRAAMERSRDTDNAALTGKVILTQETAEGVQAGILMYVPVYRKGMPIKTIEERRAAIFGWVFGSYRMNDLMQGILGGHNLGKEEHLHLQLFAAEEPSPRYLRYEDHPTEDDLLWPEARFTRQLPLDFNGQRWTVSYTQTGGGLFAEEYLEVWLIASQA